MTERGPDVSLKAQLSAIASRSLLGRLHNSLHGAGGSQGTHCTVALTARGKTTPRTVPSPAAIRIPVVIVLTWHTSPKCSAVNRREAPKMKPERHPATAPTSRDVLFLFISVTQRVNHLSAEGAPSDNKVDYVVGVFASFFFPKS